MIEFKNDNDYKNVFVYVDDDDDDNNSDDNDFLDDSYIMVMIL